MEEQNCNSLQFSPLAINWIVHNACGLHGDHDANQHYMTTGINGIHQESVLVPHWMHCQQTPRNYVEFLAERGYPELQKQIPYEISTQVPSLGQADPSQLKQNWNEETSHAFQACSGSVTAAHKCTSEARRKRSREKACIADLFQAYSGSGTAAVKYTSEARWKRSREKAYARDRYRRLRISHWLNGLRELVPNSNEVGKGALLDNVIDHVKCLKNQVKDLCRSRLGGESTLNSLIFIEGHGHYIVQEQKLNGPLEQMMGKLIDVYPSAATELLQSRGLIVMPMTFAEGLLEPEMLDMQEKGAFMNRE